MAWSQSAFNGSTRAYDEVLSFYDLIMELDSSHKEIMSKDMNFKVYVHCPFVGHHCIVLADEQGLRGHLTLELTLSRGSDVPDGQAKHRVAPKVQLYSGDVNKLSYKGKVQSTLERLSEDAYRVLSSMGNYDLAFNNCQHFCDNFLEEIGLPGHMTDTAKIGYGGLLAAAVFGIGAMGYGLYNALTRNSEDNISKERQNRKH